MIRLSTAADADAIARIYRPIVEDTAISFEVDPPPAVEIERRIATTLSIAPWLVHEDGEGRVAGYAYASRHRERAAYQWSVDVSVYVDEAHRHRGIGRALYTSLFALLRLQGFHAAHAGIPEGSQCRLGESCRIEEISGCSVTVGISQNLAGALAGAGCKTASGTRKKIAGQ